MGNAPIRTLIVDDEPIARQILREGLETFPEINVVGEADNGRQALKQIAEVQPDLVFLDLQMPVMGGFEVVQNLAGAHAPFVVLVTAFQQHAIQAFEAGAIDYLLKPVNEARLRKAVDRAITLQNKPLEIANEVAKIVSLPLPHDSATQKVVGRSGEDYFILDSSEVLAFQADGELVWIITAKGRFLTNQSLQSIADRLKAQQFERVHRNAVVNVNHVRKMSPLSSQRWLITLSNSLQITVSKRQAHNIRAILRW